MNTVIGILADEHSVARDPLQRTRTWSSPASEYRAVQPSRVPVDRNHSGDWLGQVIHLERDHGNLWCVAEVDAQPTIAVGVGTETVHLPTELYFSAERESTPDDRDIVLLSLSLVRRSARVGAQPVLWFRGDLSDRGGWHSDWSLRPLINRAAESRHTRHGGPLLIRDTRPPGAGLTRLQRGGGYTGGYLDSDGELVPVATRGGPVVYDDEGRPLGPMWHRPCGRVISVR